MAGISGAAGIAGSGCVRRSWKRAAKTIGAKAARARVEVFMMSFWVLNWYGKRK
jgi:hypothetical protein